MLICEDCTIAAANDDYTGMTNAVEARVRHGLHRLGGYLVVGEPAGFSWKNCECCGGFPGERHSAELVKLGRISNAA